MAEKGYELDITQEIESFAVSLSLATNGMGITVATRHYASISPNWSRRTASGV
jgi:DNA-binding transcriptional LysR family regulator